MRDLAKVLMNRSIQALDTKLKHDQEGDHGPVVQGRVKLVLALG